MKVDFHTFIRILKYNNSSNKIIHLKTNWCYSRWRFQFNEYYFVAKTINEKQLFEKILCDLGINIELIEEEI